MKHYALLGHNISYSLSPKIHNIIYDYMDFDGDYRLISLSEEELDKAQPMLKELNGFNVTKPHKINIIKHLDNDFSSCGSVNTVTVNKGEMSGYSTDGIGFLRHLKSVFKDLDNSAALVLGAGGVAKVIVKELIACCGKVYVYNRTIDKARELTAEFGALIADETIKPSLIVNCTSFGYNSDENPLPRQFDLSQLKFAYDTIYNPPKTEFLSSCERAGAKCTNGLGMLINQAIEADKIMCGFALNDSQYDELYDIIVKELNLNDE